MNSDESLNVLLSKQEPSRNEEMGKFEKLINTFNPDQEPINKIYIDIFNAIVEKRLKLISEPDIDYLYIWRALQTIRILSRNKHIQNEIYKESHLSMYKLCFEKYVNILNKTKGNIVVSTITELISIIKRYFQYNPNISRQIHEKYLSMIIDSDIIDNLIHLYSSEHEIVIKSLQTIFNNEEHSILNMKIVLEKFTEKQNVKALLGFLENKIRGNRPSSSLSTNSKYPENNNDLGIIVLIDLFITIFKKDEDFTNKFTSLKGYKILFELVKNNYENEKERIKQIKALLIIQFLSKKIENKIFSDVESFISFFEYLLENKANEENIVTIELTIRSFYFFSSNFELAIITKSKWSTLLFRYLLLLSLKIKDLKDAEEQKRLINIQYYIVRILRQIYSFERNRNIFTQMIPQNIFKIFDSIKLGWELGTEQKFTESTNALSIDEIDAILQKVSKILFSPVGEGGTIGGYKILEMIGKGGFGSVYKVEKINDKKQYAMKMVKLEPEQIKYFKEHPYEMYKGVNEIKIWKKFNHPNIIKYDNSFTISENCYIVMELVEGLSLGEYISYLKDNNRKIDKNLAIKIILQTVSGLRYMHTKSKVIFRDLNPNNIMLDYLFNVKLIDFGLTVEENKTKKISTMLNQSVQFVFEGSVMYSSPEVMKNEIISYESDIWALGCIIYEMIKLKPPFSGDNSLTVANNVCEGTYEKLKKNVFDEKEIIKLVENCLIVDRKKRYNIDNVCQLLGPFLFNYISEIKIEET